MPQPQIPQPRNAGDSDDQSPRTAAAQRREAQKAHLLGLRDRLAEAAVELTCHGVEGAATAYEALFAVEDAIQVRFPGTHRALQNRWLRRDAALIHADDQTHPGCELCRRTAIGLDLSIPLPTL